MTTYKTLILKSEGMSAYGLQTFDINRKVNHFPTRSAVMGLVSAAMGLTRERHIDIAKLSQKLSIAVQVNHCGEKMVDYHTVQDFRSPHGKIQKNQTKPTYREYWCDSEHTFALSGEVSLIEGLAEAIKQPKFGLFQGRKSCPLTRPLFEKLVGEGNPANALKVLGYGGQIFSDVKGDNHIATLQVRDLTTNVPRKFAMRTVYVSGMSASNDISAAQQGMKNESA